MKKNTLVLALIALTLIGSIGSSKMSFGDEPQAVPGFEVRAMITPSVIYPYEPVWVTYVIKNVSDAERKTETRRPPSYAIRRGVTEPWETYTSYGPHPPPLVVPITKIMKPGESETGSVHIVANYTGKAVFPTPGDYFVKVGTWVGESAPERIVVKQVPIKEEESLKYVEGHRLYFWFSEDLVRVCRYMPQVHGKDSSAELGEIIRRFPRSRYAQWARLGQLWIKKHDAGNDRKALHIVQSELETLAHELPEPMRAMCWYSAGEAAVRRGDIEASESDFQEAMAGGTNTFIFPRVATVRQMQEGNKLTREEAKQQEEKVAERKARAEQVAQAQQAFENSGERPKVEASVRRFIAAHTAGRIEECEAMMTEDFLRSGSMDKAKTLAKMRKDFEKLKGQPLTAEPSIDSITNDGTDVVVVATVVYRYQGQSATQKESYTLRQEDNQWKVRRMDIISTPEPR